MLRLFGYCCFFFYCLGFEFLVCVSAESLLRCVTPIIIYSLALNLSNNTDNSTDNFDLLLFFFSVLSLILLPSMTPGLLWPWSYLYFFVRFTFNPLQKLLTLQQTAGSDASPTSMASTGALNHPLIIIIASFNSINFLTPQNDTQHSISTHRTLFSLCHCASSTQIYTDILPRRFCVSYFYFTFVLCFSFHRILLSRWSWIEIAPFQNTGIVAIGWLQRDRTTVV